jgi:hypothetical protein
MWGRLITLRAISRWRDWLNKRNAPLEDAKASVDTIVQWIHSRICRENIRVAAIRRRYLATRSRAIQNTTGEHCE